MTALILSALLSGCGGSGSHKRAQTHVATVASAEPTALAAPIRRAAPPGEQALVTAETEDRLLIADLPSGRVVRSIPLPRDPEDIAAASDGRGRLAVVTSAGAGKVSLLEGSTLRPVKAFGGFASPHIVELLPVPNGYDAYVTDDARGTLTVINLPERRVTSTIRLGPGAHHLCFDLRHATAWVALGESARDIVLLSTVDRDRPRVLGHFPPPFAVHDLACSPGSGRMWLTSASGPDVTLFDGFDYGVVFRVPVGPGGRGPIHVVLEGRYAYLTSGYGGIVERVDARTGRILARAGSPYGSFELAADDRYVVVSSLLRGTLAIYTPRLRLLRVVHVAPATREVALSSPAGSPP